MEKVVKSKEGYTDILSHPIRSRKYGVRFDFESNNQRDPEAYTREEDNYSGRVVIANTRTNKVNNGRYELRFFGNRCDLTIQCDDFIHKEEYDRAFMGTSVSNLISKPFDEMLMFLIEEFKEIE